MTIEQDAWFLEVSVAPGYWEDAILNGGVDQEGNMPLRENDAWVCKIDLALGYVQHWPEGVEARLMYKVCDAGLYWLLDAHGRQIARWKSVYVPSDYLCAGRSGAGDYMDITIGKDGRIANWRNPGVDMDRWEPLQVEALSDET